LIIQKEVGLNVENMSKNLGGKQTFTHDTLIKEKEGYLGPYPRILSPGEVQHMIFQENDVGPFWLSKREEMNNLMIK
jgi:hypothetical protein